MFPVDSPYFEMFRPLVSGWTQKIEQSTSSRSKWKEVSEECLLFYSKSAAAMWDPMYAKKFWRGVKAPKFRISINKAFELVAVFGPNLLWDVPHRTVTPKRAPEIPPEIFQGMPNGEQMAQMFQQEAMQHAAQGKTIAYLMQSWLNYTSREQPNGLEGESELAVVDALIKGRGTMWARPYTFPGSERVMTGCFREAPEDLYIDPDFNNIRSAKWIALKHADPAWEVERRFRLPKGSLANRATLESSWSYGERSSNSSAHRVSGQTNDLIVWYEIWSKTGVGARMTGMDSAIKDHLEDAVGDYAYLAIAPSVPYPLNCSAEMVRAGATTEDVKRAYEWPIPLWRDDRWPVRVLDFYPDPESAWPIPPLAPAMGELKFLNFLVPWLCQRVWSSSRDFWAVAGPHVEHYTKYLLEGADQTVIPTPAMVQDVRQAIQVLQQPETRQDIWRIIELVSEQFELRTGLTAFAYGKNEGGTQNRTAEETIAKSRAVGVRPEHMQNQVIKWQSGLASDEAAVAALFVKGVDTAPYLGETGAMLWDQFVASAGVEDVLRQLEYDIAASSIRRPNRDRDVANYQQVMQYFLGVMQAYGQQTGNYEPVNALIKKWAEYHDVDLDAAMFPPPAEPDPMQQQAQQLEMAKLQAEVQETQASAQQKMAQAQAAGQAGQMEQQKIGMELQKQQIEMALNGQAQQQDMEMQGQKHFMDLTQEAQKFAQQTRQEQIAAALKLRTDAALAQQKIRIAKATKPPSPNGSKK